MSKLGYNDEMLAKARPYFTNSLEKANHAYEKIIKLRDELMEYGWKGNASQNFYTNIAQYIEQIEKFRDHLGELINTLDNAATNKDPAEEVAGAGA